MNDANTLAERPPVLTDAGSRSPVSPPPIGSPSGGRFLATVVLLSPLLLILPLLWLIWTQAWDVPAADEWTHVELLQKADAGTLGASDFWEYRSVHRIVMTRAVHFVLIELSDWSRPVLMTFSLLLTIGSALLLFLTARRTLRSWPALLSLVPPSALVLFSFAAARTWLQPFHVAFHTVTFGAILCAWALVDDGARTRRFVLALVGAVISSLSMSAGLSVWIAFFPAVWLARPRRALIWVAAALAIGIPYVSGFPDEGGTNTIVSPFSAPFDIVRYMLTYLGAPLTGRASGETDRAQLFGLFGVVLLLGSVLVLLRRRAEWRSLTAWAGLALFVLGMAGVTAIGRGGTGPTGALSPRYLPIASLWWITTFAVVALVIVPLVARPTPATALQPGGSRLGWLTAYAVALAIVGIGIVTANVSGFTYTRDWLQPRRWNEVCIRDYAHASTSCRDLYWNEQLTPPYVEYLATNRLALFRDADPIDITRLPALPDVGTGAIERIGRDRVRSDQTQPVMASTGAPVEITGWIIGPEPDEVPGGVAIVVDEKHEYLGIISEETDVPEPGAYAYEAMLPDTALSPGRHTLSLHVLDNDLTAYAAVPTTVEIVVGDTASESDTPATATPDGAATPAASPVAATPASGAATPVAATPEQNPDAARATRQAERETRQNARATRQAEANE